MNALAEPVARVWVDLATCVLAGQLLLACWLLPAPGGALGPLSRRVMRGAAITSAVWTAGAVALVATSAAALVDVPVLQVLRVPSAGRLAWQLPQVKALAVVLVAGVAVACAAPLVRRTLTARALLPLVLGSTALLAVTGHASSSSSHFWAAQSVLVHVLAVSLWLGGLAALVLHRRAPGLVAQAAPRFSAVAGWCLVLVLASGGLGALVRLGLGGAAWASPYGALVAAKIVVLAAVGLLGLRHRRTTLPRLERGEPRSLLRLGVGECLVMAAGLVLGVALARTATPVGALKRVAPPHSEDFPTVDRMIEAPGWRLLWESRPAPVVVTAVVAVAVAYVAAVRLLQQRGGVWPARRTPWFLAGCALALWGLCGSLAAYSAASLALNATQNVVLGLAAPAALAAGGPLTLMARLRPGRAPRRRRAVLDPVNAMVGLVLLLGAQYGTSLLETSFHHPWLHSALAWSVLACGTVLMCGTTGPDAGSAGKVLSLRDTRVVLLTSCLALTVIAAHLLSGSSLLAREWWTDLALFWSDPTGSQTKAGLVLLTAAGALALLVTRDHGSGVVSASEPAASRVRVPDHEGPSRSLSRW